MNTKKKAAPRQGNSPNTTQANHIPKSHLDLLNQFDGLRQTGPDRWIARCPGHDDNSPSLSIKDAGDRLLVRCFAGCTFRDVVDALGVLPSAFFDGGIYDRREFNKTFRVPYKDALTIIHHEMWVVVMIASAMQKGIVLDEDMARLEKAGARIVTAWRACHG